MRQHRGVLVVLFLIVLALPAVAQRAGQISHLVPAGTVIHERQPAEARVAQAVAWNDVLRTDMQGRMRVRLDDGSFLTLGRQTEMRVVRHDAQSQQTAVEMLYGRARVQVSKVTRPGGQFTLRTPTAVLGAIGTGFAVEMRETASTSTVTSQTLSDLPTPPRSFRSLLDLPAPGVANGPTLADYDGVEATMVYGIDGVTAVRNADPQITMVIFLLPGEAAMVERGKPPVKFRWTDKQPEALQQAGLHPFGECPGPLDLTRQDDGPGMPKFRIVGHGTSTGTVFDVEIENNPFPGCPLEVFIPHGTALRPKGFLKRAIVGLVLGSSNPPLKNFQVMMVEGASAEIPAGEGTFTMPLRGYCMELQKLPPRNNTEYRIDAGKTRELSRYRSLVEESHRLYYTGATRSQMVARDTITQWALWSKIEKMKQKDFVKEYTKLVEANTRAQKKKWDKQAKAQTAAAAQELWTQIQKVHAAADAAQQNQTDLEFLRQKASD